MSPQARPRSQAEVATLDRQPDVVASARARGVTEVVHFTRIRGVVGILAASVIYGRNLLNEDEYLDPIKELNAADRSRDREWWDYVNLSVSRINDWMWDRSRAWHITDGQSWVLLAFDPEILGDPGVVFATSNNAYPGVERREGVVGFERLFDDFCPNGFGRLARRSSLPDHFTTNRQAEVLYPFALSLHHLRHIYVQTEAGLDDVEGALGGLQNVDVTTSLAPEVFS